MIIIVNDLIIVFQNTSHIFKLAKCFHGKILNHNEIFNDFTVEKKKNWQINIGQYINNNRQHWQIYK